MVYFAVRRWRRLGLRVLTAAALTSFSIIASSGFARAASGAAVHGSPEIDNWNNFYATDIEAAYRFLGAFIVIVAVLSASSGLVSGILVRVGAVEWRPTPLRITRALGSVLIFTAAAFLPLYAMFHPFQPGDVVHIWAWAVLLGLYVGILVLFVWSQTGPDSPGLNAKTIKNWWPFLLSIAVISVPCALLWFFGLDNAQARLMISYVALLLLGVIATSASFGQSSRIQLDARVGQGKAKHDEASTEYLLARIRTLGLEQPRSLHIARNSKALSALTSTDLSATPAGQIGSAIARVVFALRPGLTWHATVTFTDNGRIAMTLSRNSRLAAADAFSRQDVSLSQIDEKDQGSIDRARAQLLTGAAAFVLLSLSDVYPRLRKGLCGATQWRSVALQVIASSRALSGDTEKPLALLRTATNLDPENKIAQYEYLRALTVEYDDPKYQGTAFAESTAKRLDVLRDAIMEDGKPPKKAAGQKVPNQPKRVPKQPQPGYEGLALRVLYDSAISWLTLAARFPKNPVPYLDGADVSLRSLIEVCELLIDKSARDLVQIAEILKLEADCLNSNIDAFKSKLPGPRLSDAPKVLSPALAYNYACFEAQRLTSFGAGDSGRDDVVELLFGDLGFALSTKDAKKYASTDPFFSNVRTDLRYVALVGPMPSFLDLEPYKRFASKLAKAGFDSARLFVAGNMRPEQQKETAKYLGVPSATIERMYEIAAIGEIHPDLAEPGMLFLLLKLGIDSTERLRKELNASEPGRPDLEARLTDVAAIYSLAELGGVKSPDDWKKALADRDTTNSARGRGQRVMRSRSNGSIGYTYSVKRSWWM